MNTKLVLAHHQLVSAISEAMTALPVRFGTVVQSRDQLQNALRERHDVLRDDLERLAGKVEFGLSVLGEQSQQNKAPSPEKQRQQMPSGSDYMRRRLDEYRQENVWRARSDEIQHELDSILAELIRDQHVQHRPNLQAGTMMRASYLVDRASVDDVRAGVESFQKRHPDLEIVLVGPWPPYSFVSGEPLELPGMIGAITGE